MLIFLPLYYIGIMSKWPSEGDKQTHVYPVHEVSLLEIVALSHISSY